MHFILELVTLEWYYYYLYVYLCCWSHHLN